MPSSVPIDPPMNPVNGAQTRLTLPGAPSWRNEYTA